LASQGVDARPQAALMIPTYTGYRQLASIDMELADQRYACAVSYQGRIKPGGKRDKRRFGHARHGRILDAQSTMALLWV
jgi:hypothetical protein